MSMKDYISEDNKDSLFESVEDAEINENIHVPSSLQADTLFHFTDKLKWLLIDLKEKKLTARYCCEDLGYLNIKDLKKYAIPMKCFCDINLHNMKNHVEWYGSYGLAFSKEWGMHKGIQPVQYINQYSPLCQDMSEAFEKILPSDISTEGSTQELLEDYVLMQLMYWKPYQGLAKKLNNEIKTKCFSDESEWRFIPDLSGEGMPMVIRDKDIYNGDLFENYSDALINIEKASLKFDYDDIKYIIIKEQQDFSAIINALNSWKLDQNTRANIIAKIIIWDNDKGDF